MIGTFGNKIIFTVSSLAVFTFKDLKHNVKSRWTMHDVLGGKPRAEFLGPDVQTVSFTIHLSRALNVPPHLVMEYIREMTENGKAEYLVVGGWPVANEPLRIVSSSEAWNTVYKWGILAEADVDLELEEYR